MGFDCISHLFLSNLDYFQISYKVDKYLFSHAGVLKGWLETINGENKVRCTIPIDYSNKITIDNLNDLLYDNILALTMVSEERGGRDTYGSCVWADVHEHLYTFGDTIPDVYQIFGHTMTYPSILTEYIGPNFAMLDAQSCFMLDLESGEFIKED